MLSTIYEQTQTALPYRCCSHPDNQPTTEASDGAGQGAWPYGYGSAEAVAFLVAHLNLLTISQTQLRHCAETMTTDVLLRVIAHIAKGFVDGIFRQNS